MAKLLASDVAVWLTQEGQLLHGGWGYAEETPSRVTWSMRRCCQFLKVCGPSWP